MQRYKEPNLEGGGVRQSGPIDDAQHPLNVIGTAMPTSCINNSDEPKTKIMVPSNNGFKKKNNESLMYKHNEMTSGGYV